MISGLNKSLSEFQNSWLSKIEATFLWLSIFLLPWQFRHTFFFAEVQGWYFEYSSLHIYASQLVILGLLGLWTIRKFKGSIKVPGVFLLLVLWMGLSVIWSGNKEVAAITLLDWMLLVAWFWYLASNVKNVRQILDPLIWGICLQALIGLTQFILNQSIGLNFFGESVLDPTVLGVPVVGEARQLRAHGLLPHPNAFGGFMVIGLIALLEYGRTLNVLRVLFAAGLLVAFARSAWLGLVGAVAASFGVYGKATLRTVIGVGLVFLLGFSVWPQYIQSRVSIEGSLETKSVQERVEGFNQWKGVMRNEWLLGVGIGNYVPESVKENPDLDPWLYQPVHNLILLVVGELGVVGLLIFVYIGWIVLRKGIKEGFNIGHLMLIALVIMGMFDHWSWTLHQGRMAVFLALVLTFLPNRVLLPELKRL